MNITLSDIKIIEKAVSFLINHHIDGVDEESEKNNRKSALRALDTLNKTSSRISAEEMRALFISLSVYANEMSKISILSNTNDLDRAYELADDFADSLRDLGLM